MSLSPFAWILLDLLPASLVIPVQSTSEGAPSNLPIIMSTSSTSTELAKLIENLSVNQEGAAVCSTLVEGSEVSTQQLLSNLLDLEDDIVDKAAEKFATNWDSNQKTLSLRLRSMLSPRRQSSRDSS